MRFIFGPVPSRRLGRSLGVDPTPPPLLSAEGRVSSHESLRQAKTCNWNCAYCQLGRTRGLTRFRVRPFPPNELLEELREALGEARVGSIDWLTFVGSGEPTLNLDIGLFIHEAKRLCRRPVAVITNGSLLDDSEVAEALLEADAVLPTLDAGDPALFRRINRPPSEFTWRRQVEGLVSFRSVYKGRLWIEVMLIDGVNDGEASLCRIADAIREIRPDAVHLLLPTRPPAEPWVRASSDEGIDRARRILGSVAPVLLPDFRRGRFSTDGEESAFAAVEAILARHPMSEVELLDTLRQGGIADAASSLEALMLSGRMEREEYKGLAYYRLSS